MWRKSCWDIDDTIQREKHHMDCNAAARFFKHYIKCKGCGQYYAIDKCENCGDKIFGTWPGFSATIHRWEIRWAITGTVWILLKKESRDCSRLAESCFSEQLWKQPAGYHYGCQHFFFQGVLFWESSTCASKGLISEATALLFGFGDLISAGCRHSISTEH